MIGSLSSLSVFLAASDWPRSTGSLGDSVHSARQKYSLLCHVSIAIAGGWGRRGGPGSDEASFIVFLCVFSCVKGTHTLKRRRREGTEPCQGGFICYTCWIYPVPELMNVAL